MTQGQACRPCATRKVRCDRLEPCSNCKRRKNDRCTYPVASPADRIRELENHVRELSKDSQHEERPSRRVRVETEQSSAQTPPELRSNDPMMLEEDGDVQYLESRAWLGWRGKADVHGESHTGQRRPFTQRSKPHAMIGLTSAHLPIDSPSEEISPQHASILWHIFMHRVEPFVRIMYEWTRDELRTRSIDVELRALLSPAERALVTAVYLASVNSLTDDDSEALLQLPRSTLLDKYHVQCENAVLRTNLFCINELSTIKAIIIYTMASFDRLSAQSIWSLIGLTIRNAERLGLHRDGAVLGLSPIEAEERRRIWWQLHHLDLGVAIRVGLTPMTLTAGWDVKMPSNIHDGDLRATNTTMPEERRGLTDMSYCLFTYWVFDQQRQTFLSTYGRFELSWQTNGAISATAKDGVITRLEDGINHKFLQFCDPINPLHVLLQLFARLFIKTTQLRILHARACQADGSNHRPILLDTSTQSLRYNVALAKNPSLTIYRWWTVAWFAWQAFMIVLVEVADATDLTKARELWDLLASVYATNPHLLEFADDRRRPHAAEHVIAAWKAQARRFAGQGLEKPVMISEVERKLMAYRAELDGDAGQDADLGNRLHEPFVADAGVAEEDFDFDFGMDLQDIDWGFWSGIE